MLTGDDSGATDPDAEAFAAWFNANFDTIAPAPYPYSSRPGYEYPFRRLEQVARAAAFARFLYDNDIPVDFSQIGKARRLYRSATAPFPPPKSLFVSVSTPSCYKTVGFAPARQTVTSAPAASGE
jgi:hypothetical protein